MASPTAHLRLDQLTLWLTAPTAAALQQIVDFCRAAFFLADEASAPATPAIPLAFRPPGAVQPPLPVGAPVYQAGELGVWRWHAGFWLTCGASWLALDLADLQGWGVLTAAFWQCPPQDQRDFWLLTWLMLGHRQGYYGVHANGLRDWQAAPQGDGQADYLLIGPSGSGKSTLALRLIEQGWQHSGDDVVLLHAAPSAAAPIHALALRRDFALAPQTLVDCSITHAAGAKAGAKVFMALGHEPGQWCQQLRPTRLCFATLCDAQQSRLTPLDPAQALVRLAQQSAGLLTDRQLAQRQFALLARLCQQAQLEQLWLGRDVLTAPARVAALLRAGGKQSR